MNKGFGLVGIFISVVIIVGIVYGGFYYSGTINQVIEEEEEDGSRIKGIINKARNTKDKLEESNKNISDNLDNTTTSSTLITILTPNGGEKLTVGETYRIKWKTEGNISDVDLQGPGGKWIDYKIPNTGYYDWTIDESFIFSLSNNGLIYIIGKGKNDSGEEIMVSDGSDDYFTIIDPSNPNPLTVDLKVNGSNFSGDVDYNSEIIVTWEANKDAKCYAGAGYGLPNIPVADGTVWTDLTDLPSSGSKVIYARYEGVKYDSFNFDIYISCSDGQDNAVDGVSISVVRPE